MVDFEEEADIARKVLKNLIASSGKGTLDSVGEDSALLPTTMVEKVKGEVKPSKSGKTELTDQEKMEEESDLQRTVFISNLPFDIENEEVKQRFSAFGEVQSFFPVLHKVTRYGNTFTTTPLICFILLCFCYMVFIILYGQTTKRNWISQVQYTGFG